MRQPVLVNALALAVALASAAWLHWSVEKNPPVDASDITAAIERAANETELRAVANKLAEGIVVADRRAHRWRRGARSAWLTASGLLAATLVFVALEKPKIEDLVEE